MRYMILLICCLVLATNINLLSPAYAAPSEGHSILHVYSMPTAASTDAEQAHKTLLLALTIIPPENMYFYGTGSSIGLPTSLSFQIKQKTNFILPVTQASAPLYKNTSSFAQMRLPGQDDSNALIYPAAATFIARLELQDSSTPVDITVSARGLFCSDKHCLPFSHKLSTSLEMHSNFPVATTAPWWKEYTANQDITLGVIDPLPPQADSHSPSLAADQTNHTFFSQTSTVLPRHSNASAPVSLSQQLALHSSSPKQLSSEFVLHQRLEPQYYFSALEVSNIAHGLLFGIVAGLILNLMPCVLPVISLKFSALLAVSTMKNKQLQARVFTIHCLLFALGVLVWFAFLALMVGTAGWAWGAIFQQPFAIAGMGLILFLLGLSMFNIYTLPILNLRVGHTGNQYWQAFMGGMLATLLATPCSGPLLGGVIGWAIQQPLHLLMITIFSVGCGMALPYFILAFSPRLINLLPKPGSWTIKLEQFVGFLLMGGVLYFMLLLPQEWHTGYLILLIGIAFSAWVWGQIGHLSASTLQRSIARVVAGALLLSSAYIAKSTLDTDFAWESFSAEQLAAQLGNEPILLEFTADWCPTCKVLEHTTLQEKRMENLRKQYKMRTIRVDLTRFDEEGFALLEELGSKTLPLIALFPRGKDATKPVVLRDLVTVKQLESALESTFNR